MKIIILFILGICIANSIHAQVHYSAGPALENDRDVKLNRMIPGDENSFYTYRVRTRGKGTSYYIEKYDKKRLTPVFSKEINIQQGEGMAFVSDVLYTQGTIYVFNWKYESLTGKMRLLYQTVSAAGQVSDQPLLITEINTDNFEFADFDIYQNPSKTKFLIKSSHKAGRDAAYSTDFIALDATAGMKKMWTKSVSQRLLSKTSLEFANVYTAFKSMELSLIGVYFDDNNDVYYSYLQDTKESTEKERHYQLFLASLKAVVKVPVVLELTFDQEYSINDIEFLKTGPNEIVVAGFIKEISERQGTDLVRAGLFSYKVNLDANAVSSKLKYFFDDRMLTALESNRKRAKNFKYKLDYIMPIGDAVYYVGEQYNEQWNIVRSRAGALSAESMVNYEYMDVIVAKLNSDGRLEWCKNLPLRNEMRLGFTHVFKQYIAIPTSKSLYILCNDHPKNLEQYEKENYHPSDLKPVDNIHGSYFVSNQLDLATGTIKRASVFENKDYCFAPVRVTLPGFIPPSEREVFVAGKDNEIYIYTEDRGRDQFGKLKFK
jgi:hypothetical protein